MRRAFATAGVLFVCSAVLRASGARPVPVSARARSVAVSARVRDLPPESPAPDEVLPANWVRSNERIPRTPRAGAAAPEARLDGALQSEAPEVGMPGPILTFAGLSADDDQAAFGSRVEPPDTNADVGPSHVVEIVNSLFRVYDKTGSPLTAATKLSTLFAPVGAPCGGRNDGDPIVLYDTMADRWLISQFCLPGGLNPPYHQLIAVSQTGDPTGSYFLYDFLMPNLLNDYPHFGVWPDGYYMSDNQFTPGGSAYAGAGLYAFDRSKMLVGDPTASYIYFNYGLVDPSAGGMLPTHLNGLTPPPAGTPNFFMEWRADEFGDPFDAIRIYEFHADFGDPGNSTVTVRPDLAVAPFDARSPGTRNAIEQPSPATGGQYVDAIADRMMYRIGYRTLAAGVESFVLNWTVNVSGVNPTSASTYQAGVRFEELRRDPATGDFTIQNQVTYAPGSGDGANGRNLWMGSTAQDHQGNSAVGFSASSTSLVPSILWAGRLAGDPANALSQGEATMFAGAGVQQDAAARWGDYSAMSIDPSDDCTFWYAQEYYANNGQFDWATRVGNFKFPGCTAAPKGTLTGTVTLCAGGALAGAVVTVPGGYLRVTDASGGYAMDLPPGDTTVTISFPGFTPFSAPVTIVDGAPTTVDACLSGAVILSAGDATLGAESCQPPNGRSDPGETVTYTFCIQNAGGSATGNLVGTLQNSGGVTGASDPQDYGSIAALGGSVCRDFTFTVDPATPCGTPVAAVVALQDGTTNMGTLEFDLPTGIANGVLAQNFDGAVPPALPSGWSATNAQGASPTWATSAASADTAPNDAFVDDPGAVADKRLDSPSLAITTAAAQLTFRNSYDLESGFDGGVLEISIGGGAFQDVVAAGGSFVSGGYVGTLDGSGGNPLGGRSAWTGSSGGYLTTTVALPASAAGQSVVLRWRMGSDGAVSGTGWRIDSVSVADGHLCCSPIPVSLRVDAHAPAAPAAPAALALNGVLEPGETVSVEPGYFNGKATALALTGTASNFTGPSGATYTLSQSAADYGSIAANASANCHDATGNCYAMGVDDPASRPAAHWDATFLEQLSTGSTKTWTLHIGDSFADVANANLFYAYIENIFHNGITGGCGGGSYCPANPVTRAQMAVFILKAEHGSTYAPPPCAGVFADVACPGGFAVDWIERLYAEGITGGCGGNDYCPANPVTRAQMAVFLLKGQHGSAYVPPACAGLFADVPCPAGFAVDWIEQLSTEGITGGCGGGDYCPDASVTRGQMAVFLTKTFGLLLYGP